MEVKAWYLTVWSIMMKIYQSLVEARIFSIKLFLLTGGAQIVNAQTARL